ncbi:MAG: peptidylprolyl isomerase [Treponema sp. CETP13]|nr:MAG: peptidylprolyl isomerase [Treponema sp. CETP13]
MAIKKNSIVSIEYTLKDKDGTVLDTSEGKMPLEYMHGQGMLIPGLEKELEGKEQDAKLSVEIAPADAYGEYSEELLFDVPRTQFAPDAEIKVGMQFEAGGAQGTQIVTIKEVGEETVKIDANHALAGKTLFFDVLVKSVRDATEEEINMVNKSTSCSCGDGCGSDGGCGCDSGCSCGE